MKCDLCPKEATIHYTQILDENVTESHLCEACAKKKDSLGSSHKFLVSELLSSLADLSEEGPELEQGEAKCPGCGLNFQNFKKIGRLGCSQCYETFSDQLDKLLKRIHGSKQHLGKTLHKKSKKTQRMTKIQVLRSLLENAVQNEKYEEAAKIRDQIKELETEPHGSS